MMRKLYKAILGLDNAWKVDEVIVNDTKKEVTIHVSDNGKDSFKNLFNT